MTKLLLLNRFQKESIIGGSNLSQYKSINTIPISINTLAKFIDNMYQGACKDDINSLYEIIDYVAVIKQNHIKKFILGFKPLKPVLRGRRVNQMPLQRLWTFYEYYYKEFNLFKNYIHNDDYNSILHPVGTSSHPHISVDGEPCLGDFNHPMQFCTSSGSLLGLYNTTQLFLNNWTPDDAYWDVNNWREMYDVYKREYPDIKITLADYLLRYKKTLGRGLTWGNVSQYTDIHQQILSKRNLFDFIKAMENVLAKYNDSSKIQEHSNNETKLIYNFHGYLYETETDEQTRYERYTKKLLHKIYDKGIANSTSYSNYSFQNDFLIQKNNDENNSYDTVMYENFLKNNRSYFKTVLLMSKFRKVFRNFQFYESSVCAGDIDYRLNYEIEPLTLTDNDLIKMYKPSVLNMDKYEIMFNYFMKIFEMQTDKESSTCAVKSITFDKVEVFDSLRSVMTYIMTGRKNTILKEINFFLTNAISKYASQFIFSEMAYLFYIMMNNYYHIEFKLYEIFEFSSERERDKTYDVIVKLNLHNYYFRDFVDRFFLAISDSQSLNYYSSKVHDINYVHHINNLQNSLREKSNEIIQKQTEEFIKYEQSHKYLKHIAGYRPEMHHISNAEEDTRQGQLFTS
jgi:hypothetical protein